MSPSTLKELTQSAMASEEPRFIAAGEARMGGVDPLGLREINFSLMDEVFPGLNNVACHIRPFVVVTWAWRRARQIAEALGQPGVMQEQLQDFVDRIEVLFVLSQLLRRNDVDLPGRQYLAPWAANPVFIFGGDEWKKRREQRRLSTALSAPIQYGPGLKALQWITQHPEYRGLMIPNPVVEPALDALESALSEVLDHEAFTSFGTVVVTCEEALQWSRLWALEDVTEREAQVMRELLCGSFAPEKRRLGVEMLLAASAHLQSTDAARLRDTMAGFPSDFTPAQHLLQVRDAWRRLQVRQLFRLSLEALFFWMQRRLEDLPLPIDSLVTRFIEEVGEPAQTGGAWGWVESLAHRTESPVQLAELLQRELDGSASESLARRIAVGLGFCLMEPIKEPTAAQPTDRLPLSRANKEALARAHGSVHDFVRHIFESWVLAQHAFWSVGRGLADARSRGSRVLLRLRIILDEGGWRLTPEAPPGSPPSPTRDRLQTAITLCKECGLLKLPSAPALQRYNEP